MSRIWVDLVCSPSAATHAVAHHCDHLVVATVPEPTWTESVKITLEMLRFWGVPEERLGLIIVNRVGLFTSVNLRDVSDRMQCGIIGSIPSAADDMLAAQQSGRPVVVSAPQSKAAISLYELADRLSADRVIPLVHPAA